MSGIFLILIFAAYLAFFYPLFKPKEEEIPKNSKYAKQMQKLWSIAQSSMRERKPLRAEKALLTILKFDEKNAAAYNRLGILYAKEQKYDEAIECFEIAQSLDTTNASSLHNAGLIYLETGAYEKAAMAFEQAIKLEGDLPARFIALAKADEKLGKRKDAIEALESAYAIDPATSTLRQILALHEAAGDAEAIAATAARIEERLAEEAKKRAAKKPTRAARRTERAAARTARTAQRTARANQRATQRAAKTASRVTVRRPAAKPAAKSTPKKPKIIQ